MSLRICAAWLALSAQCLLPLSAEAATTGTQEPEAVFMGRFSGWDLSLYGNFCTVTQATDDGPHLALQLTSPADQPAPPGEPPAYLALLGVAERLSPGEPLVAALIGDDPANPLHRWEGNAPARDSVLALPLRDATLLDAFTRSRQVLLAGNSGGMTVLPVPGARRGLELARMCATGLAHDAPGSGKPPVSAPAPVKGSMAVSYPPRALRKELEGRVGVALLVSAKGLVTFCRVDASSGDPDLDTQPCLDLVAHARFQPARDAAGKPTEAIVATSVDFRLDAPATEPAAPELVRGGNPFAPEDAQPRSWERGEYAAGQVLGGK